MTIISYIGGIILIGLSILYIKNTKKVVPIIGCILISLSTIAYFIFNTNSFDSLLWIGMLLIILDVLYDMSKYRKLPRE